jgi:hypothetical protein
MVSNKGARISVSLQPSWAGVRLSESNLGGCEGALHGRDRAVEPRKAARATRLRLAESRYSAGAVTRERSAQKNFVPPCLTTEKRPIPYQFGNQSQAIEQG